MIQAKLKPIQRKEEKREHKQHVEEEKLTFTLRMITYASATKGNGQNNQQPKIESTKNQGIFQMIEKMKKEETNNNTSALLVEVIAMLCHKVFKE